MERTLCWYFHYMPVGNDAAPELLLTPDSEKKECIERSVNTEATKPFFTMDFQNDAEFVGGCIAGGRHYLHINANGDMIHVYLSIILIATSRENTSGSTAASDVYGIS